MNINSHFKAIVKNSHFKIQRKNGMNMRQSHL